MVLHFQSEFGVWLPTTYYKDIYRLVLDSNYTLKGQNEFQYPVIPDLQRASQFCQTHGIEFFITFRYSSCGRGLARGLLEHFRFFFL